MSEPEPRPELVAQLLRDMLHSLEEVRKEVGGMNHSVSKLEFETSKLREQVTIANGRTGKIEERLNRVDIDEIPGLKTAFQLRIEQVEGDMEAIQRQLADDMAEERGRAKQRAEDRAKFEFVWEFMGKELWKYLSGALIVAIGVLIARVFGWLA